MPKICPSLLRDGTPSSRCKTSLSNFVQVLTPCGKPMSRHGEPSTPQRVIHGPTNRRTLIVSSTANCPCLGESPLPRINWEEKGSGSGDSPKHGQCVVLETIEVWRFVGPWVTRRGVDGSPWRGMGFPQGFH